MRSSRMKKYGIWSHPFLSAILSAVLTARTLAVCGAALLMIIFTACASGREESAQTRSMGIGGYVYVAEKISGEALQVYGVPDDEVPEVPFYPADLFIRDGEGNYYFLSCNYSLTEDGGMSVKTPEASYTIFSDGRLMTTFPGRVEADITEDPEKIEAARALAHTVLYKTSPHGSVQ